MLSDVLGVAVLVPLLVVPWKYIVPFAPPLAVIVLEPPHCVPPPLTDTEPGVTTLYVNVEELLVQLQLFNLFELNLIDVAEPEFQAD